MRKTACFRPFTAHFGGFECGFCTFEGSIVQGINLQKNIAFSFALWYNIGK
jgi:hypothetical protein